MADDTMTDKERVLALVEEGKITQDEADRLLVALGEVARVEEEVDGLSDDLGAESEPEPQTTEQPAAPADLPEDLPWVRISLLAGDIDIKVDSALEAPKVDGKAEVLKEGRDFVVKPRVKKSGDGLGDLLGGLVGKFGDLDIRIPAGYGVVIDSKAGDVDISDVPFLKGKLLAGDLDAKNIGGVDLSLSAGDVDVSLRPVAGKHRISATAGDVDVKLLDGSSVQVAASVGMGDVHARGFAAGVEHSLTGGAFSGKVGAGTASLEIRLSAGDLDVVAHE